MENINLVGTWKKHADSDCSRIYPSVIQFQENGIYQANSENTALHPIWDAGTYQINKDVVQLSTSNDAVIPYKTVQKGDHVVFEDKQGCQVTYVKMK